MPPLRLHGPHRFQKQTYSPLCRHWSTMVPAAEMVLECFDDMLCALPTNQKEIIIVSILESRSTSESALVLGQSVEEIEICLDQAFDSLYSLLLAHGVCLSLPFLKFIVLLIFPTRFVDSDTRFLGIGGGYAAKMDTLGSEVFKDQ